MVDKVKKRLDDYLEFDSDEIFKHGDVNIIYGGAIRDSISELEIHDVDIMSAPKSSKLLGEFLESIGYKLMSGLHPKDLSSMYKDLSVIIEPKTYIRSGKIVQLIVPSGDMQTVLRHTNAAGLSTDEVFRNIIGDLISDVDISSCGVSYDGNKIIENFKGAILHCLNKDYCENIKARLRHPKRILHRKAKLEERGWKELPKDYNYRDYKISNILNYDKSLSI